MRSLALTTALCAVMALAGCTSAPAPVATATPTPSSAAPTAKPITPPTFKPERGALQNLAYFEFVLQQLLEANAGADGRQIIDHLAASGFDKAQMEITSSTTALGSKADSVQFSVNMNGSCLIGQWSAEGYTAIEGPLLGTGRCLIGQTASIDW